MTNLMQKGMAWLQRQQQKHLAIPVLYESHADGDEPVRIAVNAVLGQPQAPTDGSITPLRIESESIDFLIPSSELVSNSQPITPCRDDRIYLTRNNLTEIYQLLPQGDQPPWRWSDPQHTICRIHTRRIKENEGDNL